MRYYRHRGVVEKDKKSHGKAWFAFFTLAAVTLYGGLLYGAVALNGWPVDNYDMVARKVKTTEPGAQGNTLYMPTLNTQVVVGKEVKKKGTVGKVVTIEGEYLTLHWSPITVRKGSPFFNLAQLKDGDQVFLDDNGVRYAYEIETNSKVADRLVLTNGATERSARAVGTIAWEDGKPTLESL